jgi:hypothetical protein
VRRSAFVAGIAAFAAGSTAARAARTQTLNADFDQKDWKTIAETLQHLPRIPRLWQPPQAFPKFAPLAMYVPKGVDPAIPDAARLWIHVDHRELMTPRTSHPDDEDPVIAQTILAAGELNLPDLTWLKLATMFKVTTPSERTFIATKITPLVREAFTPAPPTPRVSDAEFAAEAFPFEVVRLMTPGLPGVARDAPPAGTMPAGSPLVAYAGRTDARHAGTPTVWSTSEVFKTMGRTDAYDDAFIRAFVLAAADTQPAGSAEKRGYDEALKRDEAAGAGTYTARMAFAAAYVPRVRKLVSQ